MLKREKPEREMDKLRREFAQSGGALVAKRHNAAVRAALEKWVKEHR